MQDATALVNLYHPTGALVTIQLTNHPITQEDVERLLADINTLTTCGFSVTAPGLEDGQYSEEIDAVERREGSDGTSIIDFYSSNARLTKKFLHAYLNSPQDIDRFEKAAGIKLDAITVYDGDSACERNSTKATKYIKQISPITVVYEISQKWQRWKDAGGEGKEPQKKYLVRYGSESAIKSAPETSASAQPQDQRLSNDEGRFNKLSAELINTVSKKTGLKPSVIAPILAKASGDLTLTDAFAMINKSFPK